MRSAGVTALGVALALLVPTMASAEATEDPVACGRMHLAQEQDYSKQVFEHFLASMSDSSVRFLGDKASMSVLIPVVEKCVGELTGVQEQIAILALGIVGDQMLIEGRERLGNLGFDPHRFDDLFVPALREMPLDALNLLTFRPPDEIREPAFALRDEIVENSGADESEVTNVLIAYMTGLVGVEAARKVIANLKSDE